MIQSIRERFNKEFDQKKYEDFVKYLDTKFGKEVIFRVAETPIFVDKALKSKLLSACDTIMNVLLQPGFKEKTENAIPAKWRMKNEKGHPHFLCLDFGICRDEEGNLTPKLIELQGFASLYAWEDVLGNAYKNWFYCPENFSHLFSGLDSKTYLDLFRKTILADCDPKNVVLMDLKPEEQKTSIDFYITRAQLGIEIVCLSDLIQKGKKLYYKLKDEEVEIKRIYNRLIFDDLESNPDFKYNINLQDDLDVEWVTHPHWFYRISKYTMPLLKGEYIPETNYLSDLKTIPDDLENYVLKPLFSFSGMGVIIDIAKEDIEGIKDPENWILQRKVQYTDAVQSPEGGVKCEIRMMYLWPDGDDKPTLATNLGRMSRGKMIGVRYNKNLNWVGGNIAFFEE